MFGTNCFSKSIRVITGNNRKIGFHLNFKLHLYYFVFYDIINYYIF